MRKVLYTVLIFIVLAIASIAAYLITHAPYRFKIPTYAEQQLINSAEKKLDCKIRLDKDPNVINNDSVHGNYYIKLDYTDSKYKICQQDSFTLKPIVTYIASGFLKVIDKKANYDSLKISVETWHRIDRGEWQACGKNFTFDMKNPTVYTYEEVGEYSVPLKKK